MARRATDDTRTAHDPVLELSDGWVLAELAEARLRHQLSRVGEEVIGVAAVAEPLASGESFVEHAARCALRPLDATTPHSGDEIVGAVLLRPGVSYTVDDDRITVTPAPGLLLADPGAHVHDPWHPVAPLDPPSEDLRPQFPRRPVVLFLGVRPDVDRADWARSMVNDLLRLGVDARMAVREAAEGLHLSRPCLPDPEVIDALGPQVVIPLDEPTRRVLGRWWGTNRTTMVVDFVDDMRLGVELVSWRIGEAEGRVRGRVGTVGRAPELAAAIDRLCGGPQPVPPTDDAPFPGRSDRTAPAAIRATRASPPPEHEIRFVTAADNGPGADRFDGLLDHLRAAGHRCDKERASTIGPATGPDIFILHGLDATPDLLTSIEQRRQAHQATVLALSPDDLEPMRTPDAPSRDADRYPSMGPTLCLTASALELAAACGAVVAPTRLSATAASDAGIPTMVVPPLVTRARTTELQGQRRLLLDTKTPMLAWQVDEGADPVEVRTVAEALTTLLDDHPDLHVTVIAPEGTATDSGLDGADRVERLTGRPHPWEFNQWMAQIWTASAPDLRRSGDLTPILDAGGVGLPTVVSGHHPARGMVPHPGSLTVRGAQDVGEWIGHVRPVATDHGARLRRSQDVVRVIDGVCGPHPSALAVDRFLGWIVPEQRHD